MGWTSPRRVLVVGLGSSGVAAARLAGTHGAEVTVTDRKPEPKLGPALAELPAGTRRVLGGHPVSCLDEVDAVVVSPGVAADEPLLEAARARGLEVLTEIEFAWRHRPDDPLVAVTGSNGKSTVTALVSEMLRASGLLAVAGGNLGPPASELALNSLWKIWVLEVSSFQAELLTAMRPTVGVFLNLSQDHLERHPDMATYLEAKRRLFAFQHAGDCLVLNADDKASADTPSVARPRLFSLETAADGWLDGSTLRLGESPLVDRDELLLAGRHNLANVLAASLAALELGATLGAMRRTLRSFRGLSHRHRTILVSNGVRWVDDSKATNVGATLAALSGYPDRSVHLILGGQAKKQDFKPLVPELGRAAASVYLIGVDAEPISAAIGDAAPVVMSGTLREAVEQARAAAGPGDTVLLAPACASFDQFANYSERGTRFAELAQEEVSRCP